MGTIKDLKWWSYKILPLAYDDSLSYYEVVDKVANKLNEVINTTNQLPENVSKEVAKQLEGDGDIYSNLFNGIINAIATNEGDTITFTPNEKRGGEIIWLGKTLYKVIVPMQSGTNYIVGTNIVPVNIDNELKEITDYICSHNEYYNQRANSNHDTGTYLFWKDNLYRVDNDIKINDILSERVTLNGNTTGQLTQVNTMDEITSHYIEMHEADNNLQTQIDGNDGDIADIRKSFAEYTARNGSPTFVNSTTNMTDTNKVYVLSSNGHIYYYDGNNFVDSGLVYGNDGNISSFGEVVTAQNYTTLLPDLNNATGNAIYTLNFANNSEEIPNNLPWPVWKPEQSAMLIVTRSTNGYYLQQTLIGNKVFVRIASNNGANWGKWIDSTEFINPTEELIVESNYEKLLPDLNNLIDNKIYSLNFSNNATNIPKNLPWTAWEPEQSAMLICSTTKNKYYSQQVIIGNDIWIRIGSNTGANWGNWIKANNSDFIKDTDELITASNYKNIIPDLNALNDNRIYSLNFEHNSTDIPKNLPWKLWLPLQSAMLVTSTTKNKYYIQQAIIGNGVWLRIGTRTGSIWGDWEEVSSNTTQNKKIIEVGTNKEYTSLLKALIDNPTNTIFNLNNETFNIVQEYKNEYGEDYFEKYNGYLSSDNALDRGYNLGTGNELHGNSNTKLLFDYDGNNKNVIEYFSCLNTTDNNVVDNITIEGNEKCRYLLHDDFSRLVGSTNEFKHITFKGTTFLKTSIGGGMGIHSTYIIHDCLFDNTGNELDIAYHNNVSKDALNKLYIFGNYSNNKFRMGMYGESTNITEALIYNNKVDSVTNELVGTPTYTNKNIVLKEWNNVSE